jgi:hypothetical protein
MAKTFETSSSLFEMRIESGRQFSPLEFQNSRDHEIHFPPTGKNAIDSHNIRFNKEIVSTRQKEEKKRKKLPRQKESGGVHSFLFWARLFLASSLPFFRSSLLPSSSSQTNCVSVL